MKKFIFSIIFIGGFTFYTVYQNKTGAAPITLAVPIQTAPPPQPAAITTSIPVPTPVSTPTPVTTLPPKPVSAPVPKPAPVRTPTPVPAPAPIPKPAPVPKPIGQYVDGRYTGSVGDAYYGNIQVEVTISGGKITDVAFLQYPSDRSTSRAINGQAMPYLKAEAIKAQSANVDIVSGATDSSQAFQQSLASALAKAKS